MSCPGADSLDIGLLSSVEWSNTSISLSSFLDQHGKSLPHVVRVLEGFCGEASSWTIDSGQILILHALHKETKFLAKDHQNYDLYIPRKFQVKVERIPKNAAEDYCTVRDLLRTFPNYFRVLEGIPSHEVTSGSSFKIIRPQNSRNDDCLECLQIGIDQENKKVKFPLSLEGRFRPLFDCREFFLDEVYIEEMDNLPVTVHFVEASNLCMQEMDVSLNDLGNIRLIGECETESVFASVVNSNGRTISVFPKNLFITVEAAKSNATYEKLRDTINETQEKTVKRIQRLNKLGLHHARNPIRQFPLVEILPPLLPKPRSQSTVDSSDGPSFPVVKKRSNSTPPLPPKHNTMRIPNDCQDKESGTKKPLSGTTSVPLPRSQPRGKVILQNRTIRKPPPPPPLCFVKTPPLPPKVKQSQEPTPNNCFQSSSTTGGELSKQQSPIKSPPIPPPRRRRKQIITRENTASVIEDDTGYVRMDQDLEERQNLEYVPMDRSWIRDDRESNTHDDQSNMTLEELFGGCESLTQSDLSEGESSYEVPSQTSRENGKSSSYQRKSVDYENTKGLNLGISSVKETNDIDDDYENTQELDISSPSDNKSPDEHDYGSTKGLDLQCGQSFDRPPQTICKDIDSSKMDIVNKEISRQKILSHSCENTKHLNLKQPCGTKDSVKSENGILSKNPQENSRLHSYENTTIMGPQPPCETSEAVAPNVKDHREKLLSHSYENTSLPTCTQRETAEHNHSTMNDRARGVYYENTKPLSMQETTQISLDGENPDNPVEAQSATQRNERTSNNSKASRSLTKTEQILQEMSQGRLSPIGMEDERFHQEESVYTSMNENNDIDSHINDNDLYSLYTSMDDSFDPSIYENNSSDEDSNKKQRVSCHYESVDVPMQNSKTESIPCERRGRGVGSPTDTELHYHEVDISSIISPSPRQRVPREHAYEDVDICVPESPENQPRENVTSSRPTPPQRRRRDKNTNDCKKEENVFDINQNLSISPSKSVPENESTVMVEPEPIKSPDFEELEDLQLYLAQKESISQGLFEKAVRHKENQKFKNKDYKSDENDRGAPVTENKKIKSRPPAPPPKKPLNYVKVETKSDNTGKTFKKKPPTKYSEVETKPRQHSKADDMEYIDDIELYLFEQQNKKTEQMRKEDRKTNKEKDVPGKAKTISGACAPIKSCIPGSRDSHKPLQKSFSESTVEIEVHLKKRPTVPPPKPKRLFLNNNSDSQQTRKAVDTTSDANNQTDPLNSLPSNPSSQAHPNKKVKAKKPPVPVPRKKVQSVKQT